MTTVVRDWIVKHLRRHVVGEKNAAGRRPLSDVLREVPGCWVAVSRESGEAVAVEKSPYDLAAKIRSQQLKNVAVVRSPDPTEPELVGLG